jgi:hypothetical protein
MDTPDTSDIIHVSTTHNVETGERLTEQAPAPSADPAAKAATPVTPDPSATTTPPDPNAATEDEDVLPGDTPQKTAARTRGRLQKRIDALTERAHRAEERASLFERQAGKPAPPTTESTTEPGRTAPPAQTETFRFDKAPEDFATYEEFLDARDDARDVWRETRATAKAAEAQAKADAERAAATHRELATKAAERIETFKQAHPDFDTVRQSVDIHVSHSVLAELHSSEAGPAIVYALGKDPAFKAAFAAMTDAQQIREIGRREAAIAAPAAGAAPQAARPKPTTKAPEPLEPEGGTSAGVRTDDELSTDERIDKWQKAEQDERRRRYSRAS